MRTDSLRSLGSVSWLGRSESLSSPGSLGTSGVSGVLDYQEPTVQEGEGLIMLPLQALLAGVDGEGLERRATTGSRGASQEEHSSTT